MSSKIGRSTKDVGLIFFFETTSCLLRLVGKCFLVDDFWLRDNLHANSKCFLGNGRSFRYFEVWNASWMTHTLERQLFHQTDFMGICHEIVFWLLHLRLTNSAADHANIKRTQTMQLKAKKQNTENKVKLLDLLKTFWHLQLSWCFSRSWMFQNLMPLQPANCPNVH